MNLANLGKLVLNGAKKEMPKILTAGAIVGLVSTVALSFKEAPKAKDILDAAKAELEKGDLTPEEAKALKIDTVKEVAKVVWPSAVSALLTGACVLGSHSASASRQAALTAAWTLSENTLMDQTNKIKEMLGQKKADEITASIAEDKIKANPPKENNVIITGNGDYMCYDLMSGRYFKSTIEKVKEAVNQINYNMGYGGEPYASLNDFYEFVNLPRIELGEQLGWTAANLIELCESYAKGDDDVPCLVIDFLTRPAPFYKELY